MPLARSRNWTAALALLPVVGLWVWKVFLRPRPFWVHYFDPDTSYFYEGLRILSGSSPLNIACGRSDRPMARCAQSLLNWTEGGAILRR